jgi:hypothetical protein
MITPSFSLTATERVLPKLALDFTTASLDSRVTFTRTGNTATVTNSSGNVVGINADLPRFDFDPVTLACKGLLIEEARTNLFLASDNFATTWSVADATIDANNIISPDGTQNADKITMGSDGSVPAQSITLAAATSYTISGYVKAGGTVPWLRVRVNRASGSVSSFFNLETPGIGVQNAGFSGAAIELVGNNWYRFRVQYLPASGNEGVRFIAFIGVTANNSGTASTGNHMWLWGMQAEAGAFVTSYIPTTTTALTRNADVATMTGTNFSSWYNAGAGGVVARVLPSTVSGTRPTLQFDDNTSDKIISFRGNTTNPELYIKDTTDQAQIDAGTIAANITYRLAGSWSTNDCAASLNSGVPVLDGVATIPTVNQARIGSDGTNYLNGRIESIEYYAERLLSSNLQVISSSTGYRSIIVPVIRDTIIS